MSVIDEVAAERKRQIDVEGFGSVHDDLYTHFELAKAAVSYISHAWRTKSTRRRWYSPPKSWPWHVAWWKPKNRRRDLIRAAALIVAEVERLDRAAHG